MQDLSALLVKQATAMGLGPPSSSSTSASGAAGGAGSAAGSTLLNPAAAASGDGTADGGIGNLLSAAASVARRHHPSMAPTSAYENEPYHIHVYSHKHNTHVTVTKPNGDAILSMSNGGLGFKKSKRKTFDAAFQLSSFVLSRMTQEGWDRKINAIEVVLRGFGQGREAMTKALLGPEGRAFRDKIIRVSDATRLKIGGCRSRKPRRL